jgi:hypothetical protein
MASLVKFQSNRNSHEDNWGRDLGIFAEGIEPSNPMARPRDIRGRYSTSKFYVQSRNLYCIHTIRNSPTKIYSQGVIAGRMKESYTITTYWSFRALSLGPRIFQCLPLVTLRSGCAAACAEDIFATNCSTVLDPSRDVSRLLNRRHCCPTPQFHLDWDAPKLHCLL